MNNLEQNPQSCQTDVSGSALSVLAKELYFKDVLVEKYRENFTLELSKRKVIDKRNEGYHCCHCSKISKNETAFTQKDRVIFPKNNNDELWLVNSHYDGCRGWD
jgi:hypothetical protein